MCLQSKSFASEIYYQTKRLYFLKDNSFVIWMSLLTYSQWPNGEANCYSTRGVTSNSRDYSIQALEKGF